MNLYETAMHWKKLGLSVIPIQFRDKRPDASLLPLDEKGKPSWELYQRELPTDQDLKRWFPSRLHNIGLVLGWTNLAVVDFDDLSTYARWLLWTTRVGGISRHVAERTYQVKTGRGMHIYIRLPHTENNRHLQGIDIKARGGYVLIPPSIHPSGAIYQELNPGAQIVMVEALSDILPTEMLARDTEFPSSVNPPIKSAPASGDDPWVSAERVPDPTRDLIQQIRDTYRIENFFPGAEYSNGSKRWMVALCPFHDDHHPSFWIDTARQICGCHSGCTARPLDVINLAARLYGLTNREAIFYLMRGL